MNVLEVVERAAGHHPWWEERWRAARAGAARLANAGVEPGHVVVLAGSDSDDLVSALIACWQVGALPAPVGTGGAAPDGPWRQAVAGVHTVGELDGLVQNGPAGPLVEGSADAATLLSWTSGTTGRPKAVVLGSGPVALATSCIADRQRLRRDDVLVSATPATSSFQLVAALLPAAHAGCQFVPTQRLSGPDIWQVVDQWRATVLTAYTPVLSEALAHAPAGGTTLRLAMCGGAPLPSRLKLDYQRRLHVPLIEAYGQSEVGGFVAMGDPLDRDPRALSHTGRPLPDRPAWAEPDGDLVVAGQVMQGYLGDEEATRSALRPPGLRTGDVGISDAAGYIQILGRQGEQLADGRWPRQIEDALFDDPDVLHAVLVRPPGGRLVGAVVPQADAKLDTGRLARSAGVDDVVVRARFPRTSSGKYDRRALALELTS